MTVRELTQAVGNHPWPMVAVLVALPVLAWLLGIMHTKGNGGNAPWKYCYSVLVYMACVPGMFASVLTAYAMFFRNENLLDVNLLVYVLPIISMIVTLVFIKRSVSFDVVPGFDRLSGLMVLMACSFGLALAIHKTRIFVGFLNSRRQTTARPATSSCCASRSAPSGSGSTRSTTFVRSTRHT